MQKFNYTITDEVGIHARPAGALVNVAKKFESKITVEFNGKEADATKIMKLMALGVKKGMTVTVCAEGEDEAAALGEIEVFFRENL